MSKLILIDPGHDADEPGATQIDGEQERSYTLPLARALRDELVGGYDCRVQLTHEGAGVVPGSDLAAELRARGELANTLGADLFLSLHHNAGPQAARGADLYVWTKARYANGVKTPCKTYDVNRDTTELAWLSALGWHDAPRSYDLARVAQPLIKEALAGLGIPWHGTDIMCADFAVLRYPNGPCMLLETHFGTNQQDDDAADRPGFIPTLAKGIARALAAAMGLPLRAISSWCPQAEVDRLLQRGIITTPREADAPVTWWELSTVANRILDHIEPNG